jgi:multidrug efflux pump subunit AcrA (membrane-fusion protein)
VALTTLSLLSCNHKEKENDDVSKSTKPAKTPVTIATITEEDITENVTLNASSSYLKKNNLKSTANGYIKTIDAIIGQEVKTGTVLFTIQTKEAAAYKNLNLKDTNLLYSGMIKIKATCDGVVSSIAHYAGEYVQDGDQLCTISDRNSLVFLLQVPYVLNKYIHLNDGCTIILPDSTSLKAKIDSKLNEMDATSQMISYMIKPLISSSIPENLLATVSIVKLHKTNAIIIPKAAVLGNETQTEFWVMKLINDTTAIKVLVTTGIKDRQNIEIISPKFSNQDRILTTGNYGLPDTATVDVKK